GIGTGAGSTSGAGPSFVDSGSGPAAPSNGDAGEAVGPPPTVAESGIPLALPISGAATVAVVAGGVAFSRRRARRKAGPG
ncbi:MAG: hypothetical protein ACXVJS_08495, partial [Acidimicrobiia bacterium]